MRGLTGVDIIQFMKNIKIVNCMKGFAWIFPSVIAPFGNSQHFLHKNQIRPVGNKKVKPLHISNKEVLQEANTKRKILAQSSKVFDPLSLCQPVTARSKILIRRLWSLNLGWDENITVEDKKNMV